MTPTDLPDPVVPATSRCGMRARSATMGSPPIDLPSASGSAASEERNASDLEQLAQEHLLATHVRQLDADDVAARHDAARTLVALIEQAMSSASEMTRADLMPRAGSSSNSVTTGPGDVADLALDAEVGEHVLEQAGVAAQRGLRELGPALPARAGQDERRGR